MESLIRSREEKLFYYSPYNFIRNIKKEKQLELLRQSLALYQRENINQKTFHTLVEDQEYIFCYDYLQWDSTYFKLKTYKLFTVLFDSNDIQLLKRAIRSFCSHLKNTEGCEYCFIEIPSEDTLLIQALGSECFQLTETRLTYFHPDLKRFEFEKRYSVRQASLDDIPNLKAVASKMRNDYDRFHADSIFSMEIADAFLATYVEQAVKGFCDVVLVPESENGNPDAFLTANFRKHDWDKTGIKVSKMVLSAVSNETRSGWYTKLISEMTYLLRDEGAQFIYMNTQSTNRAVFKTWEKLGYTLGCTTHILSFGNK